MATIAIDDVTLAEGNVGNTNFNFTVSLSAPSGQVVQVNYGTTDGTAFASRGDYNPVSGTLIFAPGQTSQTISVPVKGDTLYAPNETFFVNLSNPLGATIADAQGVGTIVNDDNRVFNFTNAKWNLSGTPTAQLLGTFVLGSQGQLVSTNISTTSGESQVTDQAANDGNPATPPTITIPGAVYTGAPRPNEIQPRLFQQGVLPPQPVDNFFRLVLFSTTFPFPVQLMQLSFPGDAINFTGGAFAPDDSFGITIDPNTGTPFLFENFETRVVPGGTFAGQATPLLYQRRIAGGGTISNGGAVLDPLSVEPTTNTTTIPAGPGTLKLGTNLNDVITASAGNDTVYGYAGDDLVDGGVGNDYIDAGIGNDVVFGGIGNDTLIGGAGSDTLTGVAFPTSGNPSPGLGEIDHLIGGAGIDTFVLGNASNVFYNDNNAASAGLSDYAVISGFSTFEDFIRLKAPLTGVGSYFVGVSPIASLSGSGIFFDIDNSGGLTSNDELIAVITGIAPSAAISSRFVA